MRQRYIDQVPMRRGCTYEDVTNVLVFPGLRPVELHDRPGHQRHRRARNAMRTFVGFGFGPIQAGLFLARSASVGNFDRLVVAEVVPEVVAAKALLRRSWSTSAAMTVSTR